MPNALSASTPPVPDQRPPQAQPAAGGAQAAPAPSHAQTVTALRHFQKVGKALYGLLKNPDLGKADIKKEMIIAATKLVADSVLTPVQSVTLLGHLPDRPYDQKVWLGNLLMQNMQAQVAVLNHHRASNQGTGDLPTEMAQHSDTSDDHLDMMSGMMASHYGGRRA